MENIRLDLWLVREGFFQSRDRAKEAVKNGQVMLNGLVVRRAARSVSGGDDVRVLQPDYGFVGRGALKLRAAVEVFQLDIEGKVCVDMGVATGGFSDYLLQHGALRVYGLDIGEGQIASKVLHHPGFVFRNHTDAAKVTRSDFPEPIDLIVVDIAFVSIERFFPAIADLLQCGGVAVLLIKPQFELGRPHAGVLRDEKVIMGILKNIQTELLKTGMVLKNRIKSPILGKEGNQEYLWLVTKKSVEADADIN